MSTIGCFPYKSVGGLDTSREAQSLVARVDGGLAGMLLAGMAILDHDRAVSLTLFVVAVSTVRTGFRAPPWPAVMPANSRPPASPWLVYMLRCYDGSLYTGITNDLAKRLRSHAAGKASRYTRSRLPVSLVHGEPRKSKSAALKREAAIKKLSRPQKERLLARPATRPSTLGKPRPGGRRRP